MTTSVKSTTNKIASSRMFKITLRISFLLPPLLIIINIARDSHTGYFADFGYDHVHDFCRVVTALSAVFASIAGLIVAFGRGEVRSAKHVAIGLGIAIGVPLLIHLIGTFAVNNFGGLGAE
jgi:hypothetical protein